MPKVNIDELADFLDSQAKKLEEMAGENLPVDLPDFSPQQLKEIEEILKNFPEGTSPLEFLLDEGIEEVVAVGMQYKAGKLQNVFANYDCDDKVKEGKSLKDDSVFNAETHFGEVIKEGFNIEYVSDPKDPGGKKGAPRNQACCDMVENYEKEVIKSNSVNFLRDLIGLRAKHSAILVSAADVRGELKKLDKAREGEGYEEKKIKIAGQFSSLIISLREAAQLVRSINSYKHIMSFEEFQSQTTVPYARRPAIIREIDRELSVLQGVKTRDFFWRKEKNVILPLTEQQRLIQLVKIKMLAEDALGSNDIHPKRREGLQKLLIQTDYALQQIYSNQMREKMEQNNEVKLQR
jgi:hypothetical protein